MSTVVLQYIVKIGSYPLLSAPIKQSTKGFLPSTSCFTCSFLWIIVYVLWCILYLVLIHIYPGLIWLQHPFHLHWHKTPVFILTSLLLMNLSSQTTPLFCSPSPSPRWKASVSGWELIKQDHPKAVWFHQTWLFLHRYRCEHWKKNVFVAHSKPPGAS